MLQVSDLKGMSDGWITKLERIQNTDLFAYFDAQRERIQNSSADHNRLDDKGNVKEVLGWHGTGNFDAANVSQLSDSSLSQ